jgi:putative ATP-binding cassette transporter
MDLLHQFFRDTSAKLGVVVGLAAIAGLASSLVVTLAVEAVRVEGGAGVVLAIAFVAAVAISAGCARASSKVLVVSVEDALHRIKIRIAEKLELADLADLERIGLSEIYDRSSDSNATIAEASKGAAGLVVSAAILVGSALYLLWASPLGFAAIAVLNGFGLRLVWRRNAELLGLLRATAGARVRYFELAAAMLDGAKEIKLNHARGRDLLREIEDASRRSCELAVASKQRSDDNFIFSRWLLFATLFLIAFVLPDLLALSVGATVALATATTFAWGALSKFVNGVPAFLRLRVALELLLELERKLELVLERTLARAHDPWASEPGPGTIEAVQLQFHYEHDDRSFAIGPIDLRIEPGKIVFLTGGNGSGKSTLFAVLTGLYPPTAGELRHADVVVTASVAAAYRERFSAVFARPHLFGKLYGNLDADPAEVVRLLERMQIAGKTRFVDRGFSSLALSTGQRKRLAMVVALLDDRPIFAFDEWAADQDPEFRQFFYEELLPSLAKAGKTVIAVTHDDRYFGCADMLVTMRDGKVISIHPDSPSDVDSR